MLPRRTFVWSINDRLVCVVLQSAVPVDEVHHVLCHRDSGYVDREALQGRKERDEANPRCRRLLRWCCYAYLSGPLNVQVNQSFAVALRPALNFLDLFEVS